VFGWRCTRTPNFVPDGPSRPGKTLVRTAVGHHLLARRSSPIYH
jgi:hypothetical protein